MTMTDETTPTPELPEELWIIHDPILEADEGPLGIEFWGLFASKEEVDAEIAKYDVPCKCPVLAGVHPRHRDESERRGNILRSLVLAGLVTQEQVTLFGGILADLEREKACDLDAWRERAETAESEAKSLRRMLDTHAELTAQAYREGPQRYLREMLLARKELKACRGFIEAIANGRMQSLSMADARYFLAGLDAETKKASSK